MITRDKALEMLKSFEPGDNLIAHGLEAEAVMRALAKKLGQDEDIWAMTGLLHDLDYPLTKDEPEKHGLVTAEKLEGLLPDEALQAIRAHNGDMTGQAPATDFDYALRCGETVTGLIHTNALVRPNRMEGMKPKSLKKKMKDKAFAASVDRDIIRECDKIGIDLGEFFQISIAAITEIAPEVGLAE